MKTIQEPPGQKRCSRCRECKPLDDFPRSRHHRHGRHNQCRTCQKEIKLDQPIPSRHGTPHGLTQREARALIADVGACGICGARDGLRIDHDHETGVIRGVLCNNCNAGIGFFCDDPQRLEQAAAWLRSKSVRP